MGVDRGYGEKKPPKKKILRKNPGPKGGGYFATEDPDATKLAKGNKVNTQYSFGLLRMFGVGYPQGGLIKEGKRTLSGAEADRRWSQMSHLSNKPGFQMVKGLAQSRTGGTRYVEPTIVKTPPILENGKMNPGILRTRKNKTTKKSGMGY